MFDSHCHLTDEQFAGDLDDVLSRAWDAGLTGIVTVASSAADTVAALALASRYARVHATAGVHPHAAADATTRDLDRIRELLREAAPVAIGETGLDYHYDNSPRDVQRRLFDWHLQLAAEVGRPVVVHSRSADDDTLAAIRAAAGVRGVLHCFSAGAAVLEAALAADWYVSFAGMVTFRRYAGADLVRAVPAERLLVETDSPYLAPVPHRGRRNEPAWIAGTCAVLAELRGEDMVGLVASTTANALRFYGLPEAAAL